MPVLLEKDEPVLLALLFVEASCSIYIDLDIVNPDTTRGYRYEQTSEKSANIEKLKYSIFFFQAHRSIGVYILREMHLA